MTAVMPEGFVCLISSELKPANVEVCPMRLLTILKMRESMSLAAQFAWAVCLSALTSQLLGSWSPHGKRHES